MAFRRICETYPRANGFLADLAGNFQYDSPLNAEPFPVRIIHLPAPCTRHVLHMALSNRHKLPLSRYRHWNIRQSSSVRQLKCVRLELNHALTAQADPGEVLVPFKS